MSTVNTITITENQASLILSANVIGSYGSAERIRIKEDIVASFQELAKEGKTGPISLEVSNQELKAWASGCINGWKSEAINTKTGPMPMSDVDRNIIRLSAKAMRVWETVKKQLPVVEDGDFEIDPEMDDVIELDGAE